MEHLIKQNMQKLIPDMVKMRHHIHSYPELAGEETATALMIADKLKNFDLQVSTGIAGAGIVAILDSGKLGKTVALRAELDALPIFEQSTAPYKSKIDGKMHACGHDGHIATSLTIAGILSNCKDHFKGRIKFIFQPAEETSGSGAIKMVDNNVLENPKVDAIFAFHGTHRYELGKFATKVGCLMASHDTFIINLKGEGGYVSSAYSRNNPIYIGSLIVQDLKNLQSNSSSSSEVPIISVTQFHAGDSHNIIPNEVSIIGSIRAISISTQTQIKEQIIKTVMESAKRFGMEITVNFHDNLPPVINSSYETELVVKVAETILGKENVISTMDTIMAPEGFASYLEKIPGCFFYMGNGSQRGSVHKADYDFNDETIPLAAEVLSMVIMTYLNTSQ